MGSDKVQFIKETSVKLLASILIEDRMAWYKDPSCFGNNFEDMAILAISGAEVLWNKLEEKGYLQLEETLGFNSDN